MAHISGTREENSAGEGTSAFFVRASATLSGVARRPFATAVLFGIAVATGFSFYFPALTPAFLAGLLVAVAGLLVADERARSASDLQEAENLIEARRRAEESSRAKSRFLAMVSHEVRTPLNGILGMTHLLERTRLTAEQESYVGAVRRSGKALFDLVADLLDFSTIEAGRFDLNCEDGNLRALVEEVVELMAPRAHERGLDIAAIVAPGLPDEIRCDQNRLRQVLYNLIGNAIKFTDEGGVTLNVKPEAGGLVFQVHDTGPGLSQLEKVKIFEEFEQVAKGATRRHGGVGLGLAISARLAAAMGGRIDVESQPGEGSVFSLHLPHDNTDRARAAEPALGEARVLLLTTGAQTTQSLAECVEATGGKAWKADAAEGDIDGFCRKNAVTHVIVDCRYRASADWRSASQAAPWRRILLVRPEERETIESAAAEGFSGWLVAPVRPASLVAVLNGRFSSTPELADHPDHDRLMNSQGAERMLDILVAEDNPVNALLITNVLRKEGHAVTLVEDGRALVNAVAEGSGKRFDLVITDISMPHMDGLTALAKIREMEGQRGMRRMPVVVLTADGQIETRDRSARTGADLCLEKPIDPQNMLRLIARLAH